MSQIYISHTPAEGTLIAGTAKGESSTDILKAHRARYSSYLQSWYIPRSRNRQPNTRTISAITEELKAAGYTVAVNIEAETRSVAEIEADKIYRQNQRIADLTQKVQQKEGKLKTLEAREEQTFAALPPMGEPIKVGHHSETRHRNALRKAHQATSAAIEAREDLRAAQAQLASAQATTGARYSLEAVFNKTMKLTSQKNKLENTLSRPLPEADRERLTALLEDTEEELGFWQNVQAQQNSERKTYSKADIAAGDYIKYQNRWYKVARANQKTITPWHDYERKVTSSYRISYELITEHQKG